MIRGRGKYQSEASSACEYRGDLSASLSGQEKMIRFVRVSCSFSSHEPRKQTRISHEMIFQTSDFRMKDFFHDIVWEIFHENAFGKEKLREVHQWPG